MQYLTCYLANMVTHWKLSDCTFLGKVTQHTHMYTHIYMWINSEREKEKDKLSFSFTFKNAESIWFGDSEYDPLAL